MCNTRRIQRNRQVILAGTATLLGAALWCAPPAAGQTPLTVCELIARRTEFAGKMVTVRGISEPGPHGDYLRASPACTYQLVTRGVVWPNVVFLTYPNHDSPSPTEHADFKVDFSAINQCNREIVHAGYDMRKDQVIATYIGRFVTYSAPDLDQRSNAGLPGALRLGFGPVGLGAPAQLLIKTEKDVLVVHDAAQ